MKIPTVALLKKIALLTILPIFSVVYLFGCQTVAEQAIAAETDGATLPSTGKTRVKWPKAVTLPPGTTLLVSLNTTLRTDREKTGDGFVARLSNAVLVDDMMVLPAGTIVRGELLLVTEPYTTDGEAQLTLSFDQIVDPSGRILSIASLPIIFVGQADKAALGRRMAARPVTKALAVATSKGVILHLTKDRQIELPSNQRFAIELIEPLQVPVFRFVARN